MTVPQQRSQQQPWPSTVTAQRTLPPHAQQRPVQAGPVPSAPVQAAAHRSTTGRSPVDVLRVVTYVLTSIASLLFILLVIYGAVKVNQLQDAFSSSPFGSGVSSSSYEVSPYN